MRRTGSGGTLALERLRQIAAGVHRELNGGPELRADRASIVITWPSGAADSGLSAQAMVSGCIELDEIAQVLAEAAVKVDHMRRGR